MELYENINYTSNIKFLISSFIREYDISKANITILRDKGVLSQSEYVKCFNMNKQDREKYIGLMYFKVENLDTILKQGIIEAKKMFFEANNIKDHEVLCIKNDAVFLINRVASYTTFGNVVFNNKNTYTSYYKIFDKELYYSLDVINRFEKLDIKGISKEKIKLHESYFIDFLKTLFNSAQTDSLDNTINLLMNFYNMYIHKDLEIGYYRRFDSESRYYTQRMGYLNNQYALDTADYSNLDSLDISYNLNILMELNRIYSSIYLR